MIILGEVNVEPLFKAKQRFDTFSANLNTDQDKAGAIQSFEFCYELSWKTLKRILRVKGIEVSSPHDAFREAAKNKLIDNVEQWFEFLEGRNQTTHTYSEVYVNEVVQLFPAFKKALESLVEKIKGLK
ncbi:MAG TPA: HI0074 family nucleotidyltransferase substrate-binding subunit [Gammaproteobacteria bacterium]|nr:HI0074 family nucleotidyltransferase substrate-binding subunit [Gammaproteobacteria bacterium]